MKKQHKTRLALVLCVLLAVGVLASCAKSNDAIADGEAYYTTQSSVGATTPSGGETADKSEIAESVQEDAASEQGYAAKIIRTAQVRAETKEFENAVAQIEATVEELGGYVESSEETGRNYAAQKGNYGTRSASFTLRIPAESLEDFLSTAGELLNVTSTSTTATDVSSEYYDIEARLSVLETERTVLEGLLAESKTVDNMITVEKRLYDVIYEIESYKTQLKVYDSKVSYSTVTLDLNEVTDLTAVAENNSFGARLKKAVKDSWQSFVEFCKDGVIWLIYALPTLIILAVIGMVLVTVLVRVRRKRRAIKQKEQTKE